MADFLNTSLTGLLAFQRALGVTSNNIANANTPGYTRQVAEFATRLGNGVGDTYIGGGVKVATIRRIYDQMLGEQLKASTTSQARFDMLATLSGRVNTLLADADTGLNSGLQSFFGAAQDLANDPASITTRQALIGQADSFAGRFQSLQGRLANVDDEVNQRLSLAVDEVNRLAQSIASINDRIAAANANAQPPNDLLDERDRLVLALSQQVDVSTNLEDDGALSIFIGSGQTLVIGETALALSVTANEFDPTRVDVAYDGAAGSAPMNKQLSGGAIGGLLDFRRNILDPAMQSLGQTAIAFALSFNEQHAAGMNPRGDLGGDFFAIDTPAVQASARNTGTGAASVAIADLGAFTGLDYILEFDGTNYQLTQSGSGAVIPMAGSGAPGDPFVAEGLEIQVSGAAAAGDRLLIKTARDAAGTITNLVSEPLDIAMAAPTRSSASLNNVGDARISPTSVSDVTDPDLLATSVIEFIDPNTYSINGAGAFAYTDGDPITINGSTVTIAGAPLAGDRFTIEANFGATGDNSNGLLLNAIQTRGLLDGGSISINENYGRLVSGVGGTTQQIQANLDAQNVVQRNAEEAMLSTSAVSLDEEAAKMIQYQQAYQAAAQIISVANALFDSLLAATNR